MLRYLLVEPTGKCYQYKYVELSFANPEKHSVGLLVNRRKLNEDSVFFLASLFFFLSSLFIYLFAAQAVNSDIDDVRPRPQRRAPPYKTHGFGLVQYRRHFMQLRYSALTPSMINCHWGKFSGSLEWVHLSYKMVSRESQGLLPMEG